MKTKKDLLLLKLIKLEKRRAEAMENKDWYTAEDLEIRIHTTKNKIDKLK